jgi:hypothetical protein
MMVQLVASVWCSYDYDAICHDYINYIAFCNAQ